MKITLVLMSDTHGRHRDVKVPEGDILLHAGDISVRGELGELDDFNDFMGQLPHCHKIVIAGNHDFCFQQKRNDSEARLSNVTYLQDRAVTLFGLKFYGSPWQPWFYDFAFNLPRGATIREKWNLIPIENMSRPTHPS